MSRRPRRIAAMAVAVLMFLLCGGYVFFGFQWRSALDLLAGADYRLFAAGSVTSILTYYLVRALRWLVLLRPHGERPAFLGIYLCSAVCLAVSTVTPAQAAEALKVEMLARAGLRERSAGYIAFAIEKLLDLVVLAGGFLVMTVLLGRRAVSSGLISLTHLAVLGGGVAMLVTVLLVVFRQVNPELFRQVRQGWSDGGAILQALLLTVLSWLLVLFGWQVSLLSLRLELDSVEAVLLMLAATLINMLSLVPGAVGVSEAGISSILQALGHPQALAQAGSLILRLFGLAALLVGACHYCAYWYYVRRIQGAGDKTVIVTGNHQDR